MIDNGYTYKKFISIVKSSKLFKNMSIYFGAQMITALLPIIIIPIISRTISLTEYGDYSLYKTIYGFLIPLVGLSFSNAVVRKYYTIEKKYFRDYMITLIFIILCAAVVVYVFVLFSEEFLLNLLKIKNPTIILYSLYVVSLTCVSSIIVAYYRVLDDTKKYLIHNIIAVVSTLSGIIILENVDLLTLDNILKVHLLSISINVLYNFFTFYNRDFKLQLDFSNINDTIKYCLPLVVYALLAQIYASGDRFIINYFMGKDNVALYSAGVQMAFVIPMIGQSIQLAWSPYVFEQLTITTEYEKLKKNTLTLVVLLIIFTVFYIAAYPFIFKLFLPKTYNDVLNYYYLFVIAGLFQSLYWLYNPFLLFLEKNSFFIYITVIAAFISLTLNLLFVNRGLQWVACTFVISWVIQFVSLLIAIKYVKNIKKI
jgi:O-antigen/teichoic acid export membrane protein